MTTTNVGVQFTVTSNLGALTAQVNALNAKLAQHIGLMSKMEEKSLFTQTLVSGFKNAADASGVFSTKLVNLGTQVDQLGRRIERNQLKFGEYRRYIRQTTGQVTGDVAQLAKAQARMRSSIVLGAGDGKYMVATAKGIDMATQSTLVNNEALKIRNTLIRQSNESLINWGKNTQWAGRQLTVGLTVPLTIFGALASKVFREADAELTRLQKVYGDGIAKPTIEDLKQVRKEVLELATTISETRGGNLNEILGTAADLAAVGKTGEDLKKALDETTRFQTLGEIDRDTAFKSVLSLQTAFRQSNEELQKSINFLNAAENATSLSMQDMAEAIPRAGTVVKGLGGDIEDLTLYMTAMREGGISAAEGANALKSGLASIINPSTKAKKVLGQYGIDIEKIVDVNRGELTPTILALQEELSKLDGLARSQSITALFGKYQFARMSALFNNLGAEGSQTLQIMDLIGASAADLEQVAEAELKQKTESLSNQWERAINRIKNAMIPIGETFTKIGIVVINIGAKIIEVFDALPDKIKGLVIGLTALTAVAGPLIMMLGIMGNFAGQVKSGWRMLSGGFLKMTGQGWRREEMGPVLTPEIIAHQEAMKQDSTSIIEHSATLEAASQSLRSMNSLMATPGRFKGADPRIFDMVRYPTLTQTRVDSQRTNEQMAIQLMGDSLSGRGYVGGLLSANPTGGNVGLVPSHYRWLESQDLKYASQAVAHLDSTMSTQLLQIDEAVRRSKFGDGFAAYSHLYAEEGSTPLGSFIEWQKPNNARSGDVKPGELPAQFLSGQRRAMASVMAGGGAALYQEAQNNPQLRRALQFNIAAMEASKKEFEGRQSAEFVRLMQTMSGESAEAIEETRRRIMAIGDQWKAQAMKQVAVAGSDPGSFLTGIGATPAVPAAPARSLETHGPVTPRGRRVWRDETVRPTVYGTQIPLLQKQMTDGLKRQIEGMDIHYVQDRRYVAESGQVIKVFDLLDVNGRKVATAMQTLSGKLGVAAPVAAAQATAAGPMRPATRSWEMVTGQDTRRAELARRNNLMILEEAHAMNEAYDIRQQQLAVESEVAKRHEDATKAIKDRAPVEEKSVQRTKKTAEDYKKIGARASGAAASVGILASTMLMFAGNTNNAAVQFAFMGTTMLTMLPIFNQLISASAKTKLAGAFAAMSNAVSGLLARLSALVPAVAGLGKGFAAAMFTPWGAAAAAAIGVTLFFIKKNKDAWDAAGQAARDYADALKGASPADLIERSRDIIKVKDATNEAAQGWKDYVAGSLSVSIATKSMTEQVKGDFEDVIESLRKLDGDDLERQLTQIYQSLVIGGATEDQAEQFLDSLGQALDKREVTVAVALRLSGFSEMDPEKMIAAAFNNVDFNSPEMVDTGNGFWTKAGIWLGKGFEGMVSGQGNGPIDKDVLEGSFLEREFEQAAPRFEAWGRDLGQSFAQGITMGIITPEDGTLGEYLEKSFTSIVSQAAQQSNASNNIARLLEIDPEGLKAAFAKAGVTVEDGFGGLLRAMQNLSAERREDILNTIVLLDPEFGRSLEQGLRLAQIGLNEVGNSAKDADAGLGGVIAQFQGGTNGATVFGAATMAAANSLSQVATVGDQINDMLKKQAEAFKNDFFKLAQKNIDNYVANVRDRNQEMVKNARDAARAQVDAVRDAEKAKIDALKDAQDKRQKQMERNIDNVKKGYDKEIDAIKEAEDARQKAFDAEQERIRRLTEQRNFNIDYAEAVAGGNLFEAARIRNEQDASKKQYAIDDAQSNSKDATERRISNLELERDRKVEVMEAVLDRQKEIDEASMESAQKASDARIKSAEALADKQIESAEKAADRSNRAAESAVEGQKKIMEQAKIAWDTAIAEGQNGVAVAQEWGPKLGIPAQVALKMFQDNFSKYPGVVAGGLKGAATDPKVLQAARLIGVNTTAELLGLDLSSAERNYLTKNKVDLGYYFGERVSGKSFREIYQSGVLAAAGGPETPYIPGRQVGGNVYKGMPYIVGESGHELFVPERSGTIINNRDLRKYGRDGGLGGTEGPIGALAGLLANVSGKVAGTLLGGSLKNAGVPGGAIFGPFLQGTGLFDGKFSYPFSSGYRISSPFGYRNSPHGYGRQFHSGTDIAAPMGTAIKAIGGGIIQAAGWDPAKDPRGRPWLGLRTIINHGGGWTSYYGHQSQLLGKEGQRVSEGQTIGLVGSTGASTGPHLHLTVKNNGKLVNPGMVIPGLAKGAKINYDNTIANLHKGEAVLTAPITSKFEQLANRMTYATGAGDINVNFYGPVNSEVDVEAGVTAALRKRDLKMGKGRTIK